MVGLQKMVSADEEVKESGGKVVGWVMKLELNLPRQMRGHRVF